MTQHAALMLGVASLLVMILGLALGRAVQRQQRVSARVRMSRGIPKPAAPSQRAQFRAKWQRFVSGLGQLLLRSGLVPARTRAELEQTLASAGLRGSHGLDLFIGGKIVLATVSPAVAWFGTHQFTLRPALAMLLVAAALVAGLLLPDTIVRRRRASHLGRVEAGLADALDLLVICSQAGLGLTSAIARVAEEMRLAGQPIGEELAFTAHELQVLSDSRVALTNMGVRTKIEGLVRLGTTLVQSMQYGTPLSQALRILAGEMRQEVLTRFETRAARLGVLLTLPMILFILPCVFLVVGGPAAVQVLRNH